MTDKQEPIFVEGVFFDRPNEGAPDFIKGKMAIEPKKLIAFLEANKQHLSPKGWMNIDLKESQKGSLYLQVNTWKPLVKPTSLPDGEVNQLEALRGALKNSEDIVASEIPF